MKTSSWILSWMTPWVLAAACVTGGCAPSPVAVATSPTFAAPSAPSASAASAIAAPTAPARAADGGALAAGELRVGTSGDYAPFSAPGPSGVLQGFDVDVAQRLAADLGLRIRWLPFRWSTLAAQVASGDFDVAMSGVTWDPSRAVVGTMTRAVARGGPCVLGDGAAPRVAVNHGGALEAWARAHLGAPGSGREIVTVDDNARLPDLLASGQVGAIVTDSFELAVFTRPGWSARCEPPTARKVYWVAPARAKELGPPIDAWLGAHAALIQAEQERWFGQRQRLDAATDLVDQLARRMAFMPLVAGFKAAHGIPIEDLPREREVLEAVVAQARRVGLPEGPSRDLFALQIALSKAVQIRRSEPSNLDLRQQIRPALDAIGDHILAAIVDANRAHQLEALAASDLDPLSPWLTPTERESLAASLRAVASPPR